MLKYLKNEMNKLKKSVNVKKKKKMKYRRNKKIITDDLDLRDPKYNW